MKKKKKYNKPDAQAFFPQAWKDSQEQLLHPPCHPLSLEHFTSGNSHYSC